MPRVPPTRTSVRAPHAAEATLTLAQSRRIAIAAQGFADPRPSGPATMRHLQRVIDRIGLIQIDCVNVVARSHLLPLFTRLGPYDVGLLERAAGRRPRRLVEYWAHEASPHPAGHAPRCCAGGWRAWTARPGAACVRVPRDQPEVVAAVLEEVAGRRADDRARRWSARSRTNAPRRKEQWGWNWSDTKRALEYLFWSGQVTWPRAGAPSSSAGTTCPSASSTRGGQRAGPRSGRRPARADPRSRRGPTAWAPSRTCATTSACARSRRARPSPTWWRTGELIPVAVDGLGTARPTCTATPAGRGGSRARALLSPFDSLIFERARTEALFEFRFRLEIYVPAPKRVHGYYVLPFLLGDRLVGRVDLKADRGAGVLLVQAAHAEDHAPEETAEQLAAELAAMAGWLGLGSVAVARRGNLAGRLGRLM